MDEQFDIVFEKKPLAKGSPELRWIGKHALESAGYYPARLRERYSNAAGDEWVNRVYHGDNLRVMGHMLKEFHGKIGLIYIDPPFNSKTNYKKKITLRGQQGANAGFSIEEKQYGDIWTNDDYFQFLYERLILMRELLSDTGSIYIHLDYHKVHYIRCIMDEVFGAGGFQRELIWQLHGISGYKSLVDNYIRGHDTILYYTKSNARVFNKEYLPYSKAQLKRFSAIDKDGRRYKSITKDRVMYLDESKGVPVSDVWSDIASFQTVVNSPEILNYPTQKPEALAERIIRASSNPGDIVFDCFMGSGTTLSAALKHGRRFIGADINPGAVHTASNRLITAAAGIGESMLPGSGKYIGFEVYDVNDGFAGEATGEEFSSGAIDIAAEGGRLVIRQFQPSNLIRKLSLREAAVDDWRQLAESVMIDWNYDGAVLAPSVTDVPGRKDLVEGVYDIPGNASRIRVKITDILSESFEAEFCQ